MKYLVTDPCYLIDDEIHKGLWQRICGLEHHSFDWKLGEALGIKIKSASTGYGDWSNRLCGPSVLKGCSRFTADAGMVCVSELPKDKDMTPTIEAGCCAVFECNYSFDELRIEFDHTDPMWTRIRIYAPDGKPLAYAELSIVIPL